MLFFLLVPHFVQYNLTQLKYQGCHTGVKNCQKMSRIIISIKPEFYSIDSLAFKFWPEGHTLWIHFINPSLKAGVTQEFHLQGH